MTARSARRTFASTVLVLESLVVCFATLVAFAVGYVVIIAFLKIISTYSYMPFVIYRLVIAALVLVLLATGVLDALPTP